jgi:hypothetical protein
MAKASGGGEQLSDVANFALGKQPYRYDERTLRLGLLMAPEQPPPASFDADKGKKPFPLEMWGNDAYGDCVFVAGANGLIRLERAESRRTLPIKDETVLAKYKALTGCESPGDANDEGFVMLDAFRDWRNSGWQVGKKEFKIAAYGELNPKDANQLRLAIYYLGGIHFGFALPITAQRQTDQGKWDDVGDDRSEAQPGSWGGHAVFAKAYDPYGITVLTWGMEVYATNAFIARYADEAWAVVDDLDGQSHWLNVRAMLDHLRSIGAIEGS